MEKRKFSFIFIILVGLCAANLFAQEQSDETVVVEEVVEEPVTKEEAKPEKSEFSKAFNRAMEIIWPWPILSFESGYPEVFSFDIGLETLFIPIDYEARAGTYFAYGYARSKKDIFHRFSAGLAFGMMGLMDIHGGMGLGLMPRNHDVLHTWFIEMSARLFLLEIKMIQEKPLKPSTLVDYYNNSYKSGFKFKIGVSI